MIHSHKFPKALVAAIAVLSLAACSSNTKTAESSPTPSTNSPITIGFSAPDLSASFWVSMTYGVNDEAKKLGVKVIDVNAGGDANANQQITQLQDLLQRKVNALIVGATDGDAVRPIVEQAIAQGVPVVGLSSLPNTPKLTSAVFTDNAGMGKIQAECLGKVLNNTGSIAMFAGPVGQSWAENRAKGFKDTLAAEFPNVKVLTTTNTADNRNSALSTMQDIMQRYPKINGVYTVTDDLGAGVVDALRAAKLDQKVKVASANFSPTSQALVADGGFVCIAVQEIVTQGREAVRQAVKAARGEAVTAQVVTPVVKVTKENLNTLDLSAVRAPEGYKP
jgi:ABC-type sugar transport system substrate-binding protein